MSIEISISHSIPSSRVRVTSSSGRKRRAVMGRWWIGLPTSITADQRWEFLLTVIVDLVIEFVFFGPTVENTAVVVLTHSSIQYPRGSRMDDSSAQSTRHGRSRWHLTPSAISRLPNSRYVTVAVHGDPNPTNNNNSSNQLKQWATLSGELFVLSLFSAHDWADNTQTRRVTSLVVNYLPVVVFELLSSTTTSRCRLPMNITKLSRNRRLKNRETTATTTATTTASRSQAALTEMVLQSAIRRDSSVQHGRKEGVDWSS